MAKNCPHTLQSWDYSNIRSSKSFREWNDYSTCLLREVGSNIRDMSARIAAKYLPEGWYSEDPDMGAGLQIASRSDEDDEPGYEWSCSVSLYQGEAYIHAQVGRKGMSIVRDWDGDRKKVKKFCKEAEDMRDQLLRGK